MLVKLTNLSGEELFLNPEDIAQATFDSGNNAYFLLTKGGAIYVIQRLQEGRDAIEHINLCDLIEEVRSISRAIGSHRCKTNQAIDRLKGAVESGVGSISRAIRQWGWDKEKDRNE